MSYEKNEWQTGDTITAEKLNHMEDGIAGGGVLIVNVTIEDESKTLDKTWQQIYDSAYSILAFVDPDSDAYKEFWFPEQVLAEDGAYNVIAAGVTYTTDSPDGYPVSDGGR